MIQLSTQGWKPIGNSSNTEYFEIERGVIAAVPQEGSVDDAVTARENCAMQMSYYRGQNAPGVCLVFFDRMSGQDKGARRVYGQEMDPVLTVGSALVGGSLLGRAMASFFLGLSKPRIPVRMFGAVDTALVWARQQIAGSAEARG